MYFNVYDPASQVGGFFRLGNRANEGTGEMTCLPLPARWPGWVHVQAAGRALERRLRRCRHALRRREPFEELTVEYSGKVVILDDPLQMADPREAFTNNPYEECEVRLTYRGLSAMFGGEPDEPHEKPGEEFAKGHYEQLIGGRGTIRVGAQEWEVDGYGLRDHSWGPRYWQAPWYYRWLTANFGEDFGFMGSRIARQDGPGTRGGFVWDGDQLHLCNDFEISTEWKGDDRYHQAITATLRSKEKEWSVSGEVRSLIPLRNRRKTPDGEHLVTRISEGLTEWKLDDGRIGYGLSEYLDQIIDDRPVGIDE